MLVTVWVPAAPWHSLSRSAKRLALSRDLAAVHGTPCSARHAARSRRLKPHRLHGRNRPGLEALQRTARGSPSTSFNHFALRAARERARRDITVPIGTLVTAAICA